MPAMLSPPPVAVGHERDSAHGCCQQRGGLPYECPHRGFFDADGGQDAREGSQPMHHVDHFWPGDPREEVLGTAGKPGHLVRQRWADDHHAVRLHGCLVDPHDEVTAERAVPGRPGHLLQPLGADGADRAECRRVRPVVVGDRRQRPEAALPGRPMRSRMSLSASAG